MIHHRGAEGTEGKRRDGGSSILDAIAWGRVALRVELAAEAHGDRSLVELCRAVVREKSPRCAGDADRLLRAYFGVFPEELEAIAVVVERFTTGAQRAQREE